MSVALVLEQLGHTRALAAPALGLVPITLSLVLRFTSISAPPQVFVPMLLSLLFFLILLRTPLLLFLPVARSPAAALPLPVGRCLAASAAALRRRPPANVLRSPLRVVNVRVARRDTAVSAALVAAPAAAGGCPFVRATPVAVRHHRGAQGPTPVAGMGCGIGVWQIYVESSQAALAARVAGQAGCVRHRIQLAVWVLAHERRLARPSPPSSETARHEAQW